MRDQLQLSAAILTQWRRLVASNKALSLLHRAMCTVTYRRIAMAIKPASFLGVFVDCCLFVSCPGGPWGNTEQIVAQCRHPVASGVALDMPHRAMPSVSLRHASWPSKRPADKVHSFVTVAFVINNNRSQRPCYGPLKLKLRHSNIYYNVLSLLLCFWHPPTTMDAILASIVTGGQANIN
jgi:hypothetical protein